MFNEHQASGVPMEQGCSREEPAENFLKHVEERLGLNQDIAAAKLASWLLNYEPGPRALARASAPIEQKDSKQRVAA